MWISDPMPVTTRIIKADSGSSRSVKSARNVPAAIHEYTRSSISRPSGSRPSSLNTPTTAMTNDARIAAQAIPPDKAFDRRRPTDAFTRNPRNGRGAIASSTARLLPLQHPVHFRVERLAVPEQGDHDAQADRGFGGSHGHHEEHDDLPVSAAEDAAERH